MESLVTTNKVDILSADLVPFFGEPASSMLIGKIVGVKWEKKKEDGLEFEIGSVTLDVLDVLYSSMLKKGHTIKVPVKRIADPEIRDSNSFNQWNNLALTTGELLLLSSRIIAAPNVVMGQAAIQVNSVDSSEVNAARQCYVIEKLRDESNKKRMLLSDALTSRKDLLRYYALDALGRRSLLGRAEGAKLISKAIASGTTAPDNKIDLGYYLTRQYFFDSTRKDDTANIIVVSALAQGMVSATGREQRLEWLNYLGSCVLSEFSAQKKTDTTLRSVLIRSIKTPTNTQVIYTLSKLATLADTEERQRIKELIQAWQASSGGL